MDHLDQEVSGYYKIGISTRPKIRQDELGATHIPMYVLMTRLFKSNSQEQGAKELEGLLHMVFDQNRVQKNNGNKTFRTEWFFFDDPVSLIKKMDRFLTLNSFMEELDLKDKIFNDKALTKMEKSVMINQVEDEKIKSTWSSLKVTTDGVEICEKRAAITWQKTVEHVLDSFSQSEFENNSFLSSIIKKEKTYFADYKRNQLKKLSNGMYLDCHSSTGAKKKKIEQLYSLIGKSVSVEIIVEPITV